MATSMPTATTDVSDIAGLSLAAIAALAARDSSPRKLSHGSSLHSRTQSYSRTYPQPSSHSRPPSQSESYHSPQQHLKQQQQQHHHQQVPSCSPPSKPSKPSKPKHIADSSINATGVFSPPPFPSDQTTSASHEHYQQQCNRRSPSPSAARTIPKMAAARRPLPSAAFNGSAASSNSPRSKPPSRRPSASSASSILSATRKGKMGEVNPNGRDAILTEKTGRGPADSNGLPDAYRDEIIVGSSNSLRASPPCMTSDCEDTAMADSDPSALPQPKRRRSTATNSEAGEEQTDSGSVANNMLSPRLRPLYSSQQTHQAGNHNSALNSALATQGPASAAPNNKIEIPLGYWRESTVPDAKDRHAVVGFIDSMERLRTRIVQTTRFGAPIPLDYEHPLGSGSSWVTFERVVFENHLIGLDHNQVKEYVKLRTEMAGVPETPEQRTKNETNAVKEAMWRASAQPTSDTHQAPQIAYGVDLPDYAMHAAGGRPEKKRRVTNNYGPALSPQMPQIDASPKPTPPPTGNLTAHNGTTGEFPPARSPSVFSAIQRSAIDLLPGTRPAKILVGYWRGSSEERIEDKHAVLGILGANDMFRVKVTRQTRDGRSVLGNFPMGAGALWINYDEVEFEQHIRHLSRPEMKEYVRVRQRQIDEGEESHEQRVANEPTAVFEAQARVLKAGGAAQSTLGNSGRVDAISFATAARLDREAARIAGMHEANKTEATRLAGMNEANKTHDNAERNGAPQDGGPEVVQRRESSGHEVRHSRRSTMDQKEDAASIAAAAVAASAGTGRSADPTAERIERTNDIARREISRIESLQQRNEQREGVGSSLHANGNSVGSANGSGSSAAAAVPSQTANGSVNGGRAGDGGNSTENSNRQTFNENINRLNRVWASQEASRLRADGEDAKIFRGVKYERKQNGPFQGKLVSPGTILSIDGEDYVEYRVLTKPSFF